MPHRCNSQSINVNPTGSDLIWIDRTAHELRCGRMVCIQHTNGKQALVLAAETANTQNITNFQALDTDSQSLAITNHRATALGLKPNTNGFGLRLGVRSLTVKTAQRGADPLQDLSQPLDFVSKAQPFESSSLEAAAIGLIKIARLLPTAILADVKTPLEAHQWLDTHNIVCVLADDIFSAERSQAYALKKVSEASVPLEDAENAKIIAYRPQDGGLEHLAIIIGEPQANDKPPLVRLHSQCFTGDLLASMRCDCGDQLRGAIRAIAAEGEGILLYLAQEGRGIGLVNKLRAYVLQDQGFDTLDANQQLGFDEDERVYLPAALMLADLGFHHVRLMTNNPQKIEALSKSKINVVERVQHAFPSNQHNEQYLQTKKDKAGHLL